MSTAAVLPTPATLVYPDSDGQPMAENTLQFEWIVTIKCWLEAVFRNHPDVFVAGDLLWYPVEGEPTIRAAPDIMVVFGRPKGYRGSYQQWLEGQIPPQVVFEILSPGNRFAELWRKFRFYQRYGVEEYYLYDPDHNDLNGWLRSGAELQEIPEMNGWASPRLGIRFEQAEGQLHLYGPDGQKCATYLELFEQVQQKGDQERAERLAAQLRALGVEPEQ